VVAVVVAIGTSVITVLVAGSWVSAWEGSGDEKSSVIQIQTFGEAYRFFDGLKGFSDITQHKTGVGFQTAFSDQRHRFSTLLNGGLLPH